MAEASESVEVDVDTGVEVDVDTGEAPEAEVPAPDPPAAAPAAAQEASGPGATAYPTTIVQDRYGRTYRADEDASGGGNDESDSLLATENNMLARRKRSIFGGAWRPAPPGLYSALPALHTTLLVAWSCSPGPCASDRSGITTALAVQCCLHCACVLAAVCRDRDGRRGRPRFG